LASIAVGVYGGRAVPLAIGVLPAGGSAVLHVGFREFKFLLEIS
jgi:hypothetical protein